jgi:hypothetical protein
MAVAKSLCFYSANTYLSHYINKTFYDDVHYLWCSPVFDPKRVEPNHPWFRIPKSSSPLEIYKSYQEDVNSGDLHSALISQNRQGLKNGATHKLQQDVIDADEYQMINEIVDAATIKDFAPLLYVIPEPLVAHRIKRVSVKLQANPLSTEYILEDLRDGEFELMVF